MADHTLDTLDPEILSHAFRLLASAELGQPVLWSGPDQPKPLANRIELLSVLLNIVPRSHLGHLPRVLREWQKQFPHLEIIDATALRASAREVLDGAPAINPDDLKSVIQNLEARFGIAGSGCNAREVPDFPHSVRMQCVFGLTAWAAMFLGKPGSKGLRSTGWRKLPNVVPRDTDVPIEQIYVDLFAYPRLSHLDGGAMPRRPQPYSQHPRVVVGLPTMVSRTFRRCVVVGEPGSGKSTMVRWLAWATYHGRLRDFDHALAIRLSEFAASVSARPNLSLVEFFFENLGTKLTEFREASEFLRIEVTKHGRFLLLLDGWDEVPNEVRRQVRSAIEREADAFVAVVTSRESGGPQELFSGRSVDFYEIAGLSPTAIRTLLKNQLSVLGKSELLDSIQHRFDTAEDFRDLTTNPFMVGLLVRMLSRDAATDVNLTRAELYDQVVTWMVEQQRLESNGHSPLMGEHLRAVERLSHAMILKASSPRYTFQLAELDRSLPGLGTEPITASRLVNQLDASFDAWSFLHATFAEYFAARSLAGLPADELKRQWDKAICSRTRLVTLGFFAGMRSESELTCRELIEPWLKNPDRFELLILRLAQVTSRGRWRVGEPALVAQLEDRLWTQVVANPDWLIAGPCLTALVELNQGRVLEFVGDGKQKDFRILERLCDLLPAKVVRESDVYPKLPQHLQDLVLSRAVGGSDEVDCTPLMSALADRDLDMPSLLRAIRAASSVPKPAVAELLLDRLMESNDETVRSQVTLGLAAIFGCLPVERVLGIVLDGCPEPVVRRMAGAALSHAEKNDGARLDAEGRDRILRRLAVVHPGDERVEPMLASLRGYPIREGGELIAEFAVNSGLEVPGRQIAVGVLQTVTNDEVLEACLETIGLPGNSDIQSRLLELAVVRQIHVPREWLEERVRHEANSWQRRALLQAYAIGWGMATGDEANAYKRFLLQRVTFALADESHEDDAIALELAGAFCHLQSERHFRKDKEFSIASMECLKRFIANPENVSISQIKLAGDLLRLDGRMRANEYLADALNVLLGRMKTLREKGKRLAVEGEAIHLAEILALRAPEVLLGLADKHEPVLGVLKNCAIDRGWLVFTERILDADGRELANVSVPKSTDEPISDAITLPLVSKLTKRLQRAVMSRWCVVVAFKLCDPNARIPEIYASLLAMCRGDCGAAAKEQIEAIYADGPPDIETWRRYVRHAATRICTQPNGRTWLRELGIESVGTRRRRRS